MLHESLSLTVDIYNINMDTFNSAFYFVKSGFVAIYNATTVSAHFSGQVNMPKDLYPNL